jgi:hypothetical protein
MAQIGPHHGPPLSLRHGPDSTGQTSHGADWSPSRPAIESAVRCGNVFRRNSWDYTMKDTTIYLQMFSLGGFIS